MAAVRSGEICSHMPTTDYADLDLVITRIARGRYQAQMVDSPAGQASIEFRRPFSEIELDNFVLKILRAPRCSPLWIA